MSNLHLFSVLNHVPHLATRIYKVKFDKSRLSYEVVAEKAHNTHAQVNIPTVVWKLFCKHTFMHGTAVIQ